MRAIAFKNTVYFFYIYIAKQASTASSTGILLAWNHDFDFKYAKYENIILLNDVWLMIFFVYDSFNIWRHFIFFRRWFYIFGKMLSSLNSLDIVVELIQLISVTVNYRNEFFSQFPMQLHNWTMSTRLQALHVINSDAYSTSCKCDSIVKCP